MNRASLAVALILSLSLSARAAEPDLREKKAAPVKPEAGAKAAAKSPLEPSAVPPGSLAAEVTPAQLGAARTFALGSAQSVVNDPVRASDSRITRFTFSGTAGQVSPALLATLREAYGPLAGSDKAAGALLGIIGTKGPVPAKNANAKLVVDFNPPTEGGARSERKVIPGNGAPAIVTTRNGAEVQLFFTQTSGIQTAADPAAPAPIARSVQSTVLRPDMQLEDGCIRIPLTPQAAAYVRQTAAKDEIGPYFTISSWADGNKSGSLGGRYRVYIQPGDEYGYNGYMVIPPRIASIVMNATPALLEGRPGQEAVLRNSTDDVGPKSVELFTRLRR